MPDINYEIVKQIGVLSRSSSGWSDRAKMGKGVTLSREELLRLKELLNSVEL